MTDVWNNRQSGDANQRPNDQRDPFQRDRARILHSAAFRRLQSKTQILGVGQDDFYRTRLTHSLEVAQIGTGLTAQLRQNNNVLNHQFLKDALPSDALIESLCLAHYLGHPPFGHGGEIALNYMMKSSGGFEANGQTFRIATKLEPYTPAFGMDLTRRTLLGLVKYPLLIKQNPEFIQPNNISTIIRADSWKPIKGLFDDDKASFDWLLQPLSDKDRSQFLEIDTDGAATGPFLSLRAKYKSLDCSIMELADDIAYGVHDLEDAIVLGKVTSDFWHEEVLPGLLTTGNPWAKKHAKQLSIMLFSKEHHQRKNAIGALVNHLITNISIVKLPTPFAETLLQYNAQLLPTAQPVLDLLKRFVFKHVIQNTEIQQLEFKGQRMLISLFEAFSCDPKRLLPTQVKQLWLMSEEQGLNSDRIICDYLAGMSDDHAIRVYNRLFGM
ncbi:deoxyguanosinetriphosphate triphosphohydrolase family protein [Psychrosphaera sp. B3R10]|uniref:anti-phage deoxyguanosine triphosphatase n=1 Tax=unclassified Psychrosphaera TaxID=2641570 RepID=UPI001C0A000E|nr:MULTISPECIES: anti-phage deoxyguanosine triphosphatase [unclassified Psychrosphaera]MBU2882369.1 deoxyguanosinetriphosphate triphosphohydrolase family protein [Psychrosphaera sp. I2R16]MBU2989050.1 deoxyguanosinetriphosphate triphosphohydrolase family protein [Psychrosphaera sp. B3R10]